MSTSLRPSPRTSTGTLLITFFLGLLIGISAGYTFRGPSPFHAQEPPTADALPPTVSVETEAPPLAPAPPPAYEESLWPGRHLIVPISSPVNTDTEREFLRDVLPGGVYMAASILQTPAQTRQVTANIRAAMGLGTADSDLPLIVARPADLPDIPPLVSGGEWPSLKQIAGLANAYAAACRERGVTVLLMPDLELIERSVADLPVPPGDQATAQDRAIALALTFADALLERGVLTVASSYPGTKRAMPQAGVSIPVLDIPINALAETLYPFSEAIAQEIPGMLVGHVAVPALDRAQPQRPASLSPVLVEAVLREKWGYQGVIVAEDVSILPGTGVETAVVQALRAGCDAVIINSNDPVTIRSAVAAVETAVGANALSADALQRSKKRLDAWQLRIAEPRGLKGPLPVYASPAPATVEPSPPVEAEPAQGKDTPPPPEAAPAPQEAPAESAPEVPAVKEAPEPAGPAPQPPDTRKEIYVVKPGDRLMRIAQRFDVSADEVVRWNALRDADDIKYGQRLVIYLPQESEATEAPAAAPVAAPAEAAPAETAPVEPAVVEPVPAPEETPEAVMEVDVPEEEQAQEEPAPEAVPAPEDARSDAGEAAAVEPVRHRVAAGETVRSIARRYNVSWRDIVEWNDLRDADDIKQGQRIVVKAAQGE